MEIAESVHVRLHFLYTVCCRCVALNLAQCNCGVHSLKRENFIFQEVVVYDVCSGHLAPRVALYTEIIVAFTFSLSY